MEYWSPTPLPEGDPGNEITTPAELRQPTDEDMEFSPDSSVVNESEVEVTDASRLPTAAALRRKMRRTVKKIPMSKARLTAAQRSLRSSTPKGTSKFRGASTPPATTVVGSTSASPQAEKEATPLCSGYGARPTAPLKLKFALRRSGG